VSDQKTSYKKKNSRAAAFTGLAIAGTGVSHFTSPALFEGVTKSAFPRDTRRHVYTNGGIETALGLGFSAQDPAAGDRRPDRLRRLSGRQRPPQPVARAQWPVCELIRRWVAAVC
jgi:hypothetical protein